MSLRANMSIENSTIFLRLEGELDESSIKDVRSKLVLIMERHQVRNIVFNLKKLEFMDSSGIGLILGRYEEVKKKNGQVILCDLNQNIEKIIILSGLLRICTLRENEESAKWFLEDRKWQQLF